MATGFYRRTRAEEWARESREAAEEERALAERAERWVPVTLVVSVSEKQNAAWESMQGSLPPSLPPRRARFLPGGRSAACIHLTCHFCVGKQKIICDPRALEARVKLMRWRNWIHRRFGFEERVIVTIFRREQSTCWRRVFAPNLGLCLRWKKSRLDMHHAFAQFSRIRVESFELAKDKRVP